MPTVHGAPLSPFVRKVLVTLEMKGIAYDLNPVVPMNLPAEFYEMSPLGKIPAYEDARVRVSDSSVICQYLEDAYPEPAVYPADIADRAQARWLEEYADTKLIEVTGPPLFFERVVKPRFLAQETDEERVRDNLENALPPVMDYLDKVAPERGFLLGDFGIADIAIGSPLVNARFARFEVDAGRWPKLAQYVERTLNHELFRNRLAAEADFMQQWQ